MADMPAEPPDVRRIFPSPARKDMQASIDINCDMGESHGACIIGNDAAIMPLVSSANIACGFHGGDPAVIHRTVRLAQEHGVKLGAHPSYPDRAGFGRREMAASPQEVYDDMLYQIGGVYAIAKAAGMALHHVKPHGALYNRAARDAETALAIVHAVFHFDRGLVLYGPPGSELERSAAAAGIRYYREAFSDRAYEPDGSLCPRSRPGAVLRDSAAVVRQVSSIVERGMVTAVDGTELPMPADTICIHGDGPHAVEFAKAIVEAFKAKGIEIRHP